MRVCVTGTGDCTTLEATPLLDTATLHTFTQHIKAHFSIQIVLKHASLKYTIYNLNTTKFNTESLKTFRYITTLSLLSSKRQNIFKHNTFIHNTFQRTIYSKNKFIHISFRHNKTHQHYRKHNQKHHLEIHNLKQSVPCHLSPTNRHTYGHCGYQTHLAYGPMQ